MLRVIALLFLCTLLSASALAQKLKLYVDQPLQAYDIGETIVFKVESELRGPLTYEIGFAARTGLPTTAVVNYTGGVLEIRYTAQVASFLLIKVRLGGQNAELGVVVARDEIDALAEEPADFDAFWTRQKGKLAAVPLDVKRKKIGETALSTSYEFSAAQIDGRRVYGYYVVPKGDGPKPAAVRLPPYGASANITGPQTDLAEKGNMVAFSITIHNAPVNQVDPNAYEPDDIRDAETIYYRYAVLAAIRTIDVLATLPEWNGKDLLITGESQGGGISILTAGIDRRVTLLVESVAALSQLNGEEFDRPSGFPYYLEAAQNKYGDTGAEQTSRAVKYYDAIYAARRYEGPSLHYTNYLDNVVPPATAYAAVNAMAGPRVVLHSFDLYHGNPPSMFEDVFDFARLHFESARRPPFIYASKRLGHEISAGSDATAEVGTALTLRGKAGVDGGSLGTGWTVQWRQVSGPGKVVLGSARSLNTSVTFPAPGTYVLELQVVDPYADNPRAYFLLSDRVTVTVTKVSGVATPLHSLDRAEVYPNPATDLLHVTATFGSSDEIDVELVDLLGRVVERRGPFAVSAERPELRERFAVAGLPNGSYVLVLTGREGTFRQHVTVAR